MKTLLVGVSTRAMAESAVGSGHAVVALDAFGDLDLERLCECYSLQRDFGQAYSAPALLNASRRIGCDAVAYTSNLENYPDVVHGFQQTRRLLGNPAGVVRRVRRWPALADALTGAGFRTPESFFSVNGRRPDPQRRWLAKPLRSGGGLHVDFWQPSRPLKSGFMLQEYLEGAVCSAAFVANGQEAVVIGLSEQLAGLAEFGAHGFLYCGNITPLDAGADQAAVLDQAQRIASRLTREFGLTGVNGLDFILADGRVCPIEINPRYSASMELIEQAYGLPIFDLHVRAVIEGALPAFDLHRLAHPAGCFYGKAILYAEKSGRAPDTRSWPERSLRDVPHPGERLIVGQPICTILASGENRDLCFKNLVARAEPVKGEIYA